MFNMYLKATAQHHNITSIRQPQLKQRIAYGKCFQQILLQQNKFKWIE